MINNFFVPIKKSQWKWLTWAEQMKVLTWPKVTMWYSFYYFTHTRQQKNVNEQSNLNPRDLISFTLPKPEFGISIIITIMAWSKYSAQSITGYITISKKFNYKKKYICKFNTPPMAVVDLQNWKPQKV